MALLTATDYDSVRWVIDITLDGDTLPDSVIEQPIYGAQADLWVRTQDPLWASRTGTEQRHLINAAVYFCASLICPAIPNLTSESHGPHSWQRQAVDWAKRAADLRAKAQLELEAVVATTAPVRVPTLFAVARGRRGQ